MNINAVTVNPTMAYIPLTPIATRIMAKTTAANNGAIAFFINRLNTAFCQEMSGQIAIKKSRASIIGAMTLLK
ncbi:hypothetical protein ACFYKT_17855 [Cytobacillus sp. FJAT-53684]|uniref:Uncharacterized protein n=1 Tax=Cytobacillus mangrovibacter TaxID=3299024 RepID=A0ABW6K1Y8_9BACI